MTSAVSAQRLSLPRNPENEDVPFNLRLVTGCKFFDIWLRFTYFILLAFKRMLTRGSFESTIQFFTDKFHRQANCDGPRDTGTSAGTASRSATTTLGLND